MKSRIWEKKEGNYAKTFTKIQVTINFSPARYAEKLFPQIYRDLYGDAMLVPIRMGTNMAAGPTETSVTEFCYKRGNLSLEELKKND